MPKIDTRRLSLLLSRRTGTALAAQVACHSHADYTVTDKCWQGAEEAPHWEYTHGPGHVVSGCNHRVDERRLFWRASDGFGWWDADPGAAGRFNRRVAPRLDLNCWHCWHCREILRVVISPIAGENNSMQPEPEPEPDPPPVPPSVEDPCAEHGYAWGVARPCFNGAQCIRRESPPEFSVSIQTEMPYECACVDTTYKGGFAIPVMGDRCLECPGPNCQTAGCTGTAHGNAHGTAHAWDCAIPVPPEPPTPPLPPPPPPLPPPVPPPPAPVRDVCSLTDTGPRCLHGGECVDVERNSGMAVFHSQQCICTSGFTGLQCQELAEGYDACSPTDPSPIEDAACLHGGRCVSSTDGWRCICLMGFVGWNCETEVPSGPIEGPITEPMVPPLPEVFSHISSN